MVDLGEKVPGFKPNANKMRVQKIENALHCIAFMKKNGVRMYNVSAEGPLSDHSHH